MVDPFMAALLAGGFLALVYLALHVMGPTVPGTEVEARPFYYGIGFGCFLIVGWGWAITTGNQGAMAALTLIGFIGGLGTVTAYLWDALQRRRDTAAVDDSAGGTPDV